MAIFAFVVLSLSHSPFGDFGMPTRCANNRMDSLGFLPLHAVSASPPCVTDFDSNSNSDDDDGDAVRNTYVHLPISSVRVLLVLVQCAPTSTSRVAAHLAFERCTRVSSRSSPLRPLFTTLLPPLLCFERTASPTPSRSPLSLSLYPASRRSLSI